MLRQRLFQAWYAPRLTLLTASLLPLSWVFNAVVRVRRFLYLKGFLPSQAFPVPVVVIGNISLGGTGKTPVVIAVASLLQSQGLKVGIVSRGFGGRPQAKPLAVNRETLASECGDEPLLIAVKTGCPVVVCTNRVAAVEALLAQHALDVVLSDDGLQHYQLQRACEIALVDVKRGLGNEQLLPAGPLREPASRLSSVDAVLYRDGVETAPYAFHCAPVCWRSVKDPQQTLPLNAFAGKTVHAVAGIAFPERYFESLKQLGCLIVPHPFADHFAFTASDITFNDGKPVLMTEKDAAKCQAFATDDMWALEIAAILPQSFNTFLLSKVKRNERV